jgi:hypothetical protein
MWSRPDPRRPEFSRPEFGRPRPPGISASRRRKCWSRLNRSRLRWSRLSRSRIELTLLELTLLELAPFILLGSIRTRLELAPLVERRWPIRARLELARLAEPVCLMQLGIKLDRLAGIAALCVELGLLNGSRSEPLAVGGPHVGTCIRLGSTRPMPGRMGASPSHIGHQSPLCYLRRRMARSTSRVASLRASSCRLS